MPSPTTTVKRAARAKVNLSLHVTGRRADGYHLLDSLVVFADLGDVVRARAADALTLAVSGPFANGVPTGRDNLMMQAAALFPQPVPAALALEKNLPPASGIGGGSADAAATLLALSELLERPLPDSKAVVSLGADVPVCLAGQAVRMRGIGERLDTVPPLPPVWLVLANPGVAVGTGPIFAGLSRKTNPEMPPMPPDGWPEAESLAAWLAGTRNDLQMPAVSAAPQISDVLAALAGQPGCLLSRMSGSGATCFGLFATSAAANAAARAISGRKAGWWVRAAAMVS
ncbi:MAG: 4-(cytidine 5'-diphospho)-2-C-methyl-D-erythritol kinase [Pseudomonadota bacterium]